MITLKTLYWNRMFSYGNDNTVTLNDQPVTQILGANGHGKSSIPLVLEEVLFNKNSKGIKKSDIINRNLDTNKYNAYLVFSINSDEYKLDINRTGAVQKVKLQKNGVDISSHTATETFKQVEEILGIDQKTFSQIVYQNNSSSLQFLTATDTNRKKFLIDLLSLEKYIILFERIKAVHKEVSESLIKIESSYNTINKWVEEHSKDALNHLEYIVEPEPDNILETELIKVQRDLDNIVTINKKIANNNYYIEALNKIPKDKLISDLEKKDVSDIINRISVIKHEVKNQEAFLEKLKNIEEKIECPTCYQHINTEKIEELKDTTIDKIDTLTQELSKNKLEQKNLEDINKKVSEHEALIADFEKYSALLDTSLPSMLLDKKDLEQKIYDISLKLKNIQENIKKAKEFNKNVAINNSRVDTIKNQLEEEQNKLIELRIKLVAIENKFAILEVLKKAFSTNGLLAYKIENSVKDLQELTNYYLTELSDGRFQLNFSINNDKLNVIIIDNGISVEITALSAGELARVTTSTLLAIRKLMTGLSKTRINVLFLDETIDVLDTFGKERLIEVLLKEEYLNTFLISHGYSHPLIKKITAIKEDGISRLEDGI